MGNVLAEAKAARDAVIQHNRIVQVGTQHRSEPHPNAARDVVQTGVLGQVSKVEVVWNYHWPALARTPGNEADSRRRYRLAQMAADQALSPVRSASLLRISLVQGILERNPRPMDEPRDRHGALVLERQFSALGDCAWRDFCLA